MRMRKSFSEATNLFSAITYCPSISSLLFLPHTFSEKIFFFKRPITSNLQRGGKGKKINVVSTSHFQGL